MTTSPKVSSMDLSALSLSVFLYSQLGFIFVVFGGLGFWIPWTFTVWSSS